MAHDVLIAPTVIRFLSFGEWLTAHSDLTPAELRSIECPKCAGRGFVHVYSDRYSRCSTCDGDGVFDEHGAREAVYRARLLADARNLCRLGAGVDALELPTYITDALRREGWR